MGRSKYVQFVNYPPTKCWDANSGARTYPDGIFNYIPHSILGKHDLQYSQGNPYHELGKSGKRIGGNFFVVKNEWTGNVIQPRPYSNTLNPHDVGFHYDGPVYENTGYSLSHWPAPWYSSSAELDVQGTSIIANVIPTNPLSGLFVSLGELKRDGLPSLIGVQSWRDRTRIARGAGKEYLNAQFGWIPLVNELKSFTHSVRNSEELTRQYERNSGRKIKRKVALPVDSETLVGWGTNRSICPAQPKMYAGSSYKHFSQTTVKSKRRWFSAAFTYYLPPFKTDGDNFRRNEQLANYLYGTRVTPEGIWDLTPWTWAADWVGNFGDVLHNVAAFRQDGLVMQYGYMMEEGIHQHTYSHPDVRFHTYPGVKNEVTATVRTIVKQRRVATPYGFGINVGTFTGRQWAILAALGLSRGNNTLYS